MVGTVVMLRRSRADNSKKRGARLTRPNVLVEGTVERHLRDALARRCEANACGLMVLRAC
jgi:hypothetical protein